MSNEPDLTDEYTLLQAIELGILVDVTNTAKKLGIKSSVFLTRAVWCRCVEVPEGARFQDEAMRLSHMLCMLASVSPDARCPETYPVYFCLRPRSVLKAACCPDDDGSPCILVMLPEEG